MPGSKFRRARMALLAMAVMVGASAVAGWALMVSADHRHDLAEAQTRSRNLARLVDEHASRTMEATALVLSRMVDRVETHGLDAVAASTAEWQMLVRMAEDLPELGSLLLADAEGRVVLGSLDRWPEIDLSDREYFQAHRQGARLHFGRSIVGRDSGRPSFTLSRRVEDAAGRFLGVAVATVHSDYFRSFYRGLDLGEQAMIAIYREDGAIVVRAPEAPADMGSAAGKALFREHLPQGPVGTYLARSAVDGVERIHSYRHVTDLPLVVVVGLGTGDMLAPWRERAWISGSVLLGFLAAFAILLNMARTALGREELGRAALADANASLERRVADRTRALTDANARLAAALQERERAIETRTRFFAAANHDLRQPFQALRLFYDLLSARVTAPAERQVLEPMGEALAAGEGLLSALLDVSTLDRGDCEVAPQSVALAPLLDRLSREIGPQAERAGLRFRAVPCTAVVETDPQLLERLLRNLLSNAVKYTDAGSVLLGCRRKGDEVVVEVIDTGLGIDPGQLELIFEDFYQVGNAERDRRHGLGLGLGIVNRIAGLLGHDLEVASRPGKGSRFSVTLPCARTLAAEAAQ